MSRSSYYVWRKQSPSARARADAALTEQIRALHTESRQTYGSPRIHAELRARGQAAGRCRVARLMRQAGLRGHHGRRRRVRTTVPDPAATPAPDRVERDERPCGRAQPAPLGSPAAFAPAQIGAPNRVWFADISYVATLEGWLYLAVILDGFSRRVVGWAMADHLRTELVSAALTMALQRRLPAAGLIHHADHGCQYTSLAFGHQLAAAGLVGSTGSVGDCFDNAVAESFFATLKTELLDRQIWATRAAAERAIFEYVEVWYNRRRRHSTLGYLAPTAFETEFAALANHPEAA